MQWPAEFLEGLPPLLERAGLAGQDAAFLNALQRPPCRGLRANLGKGSPESLWAHLKTAYGLPHWQPVPWVEEGMYLPEGWSAAQTPEYQQGLFYLQEASAMLPGQVAQIKPGDHVLDLCAAPGGKACKLADRLGDSGVLVCNEPSLERARVLLRNLEQWGAIQTWVVHAKAQDWLNVKPLPQFEVIVVDAPCSGEGMFSRDPRALKAWSTYASETCQGIQQAILEVADTLLAPGGQLVYSTCTFNLGENEAQVARFLNAHPEYALEEAIQFLPPRAQAVVSPGIEEVKGQPTKRCLRIWPHLAKGEGHFCASLRKAQTSPPRPSPGPATAIALPERLPKQKNLQTPRVTSQLTAKNRQQTSLKPAHREAWLDWQREHLSERGQARLAESEAAPLDLERTYLHLLKTDLVPQAGLHWLKRGLLLGQFKAAQRRAQPEQSMRQSASTKRRAQSDQERFIPAHSLALALREEEVKPCARVNLQADDPRAKAYIAGQTLLATPEEQADLTAPYLLLFYEGHPLGWVINQKQYWKNLYPKSWVRTLRDPWETQ